MRIIAFLVLALSFFSVGRSQSAASRANDTITVGPKIHVSKDRPERTHWETVLAVDPENAQNMLACWIDGEEGKSKGEKPFSVVYASHDGGESWRKTLEFVSADLPPVDPHCAYGPGGVAYAVALVAKAPTFMSADAGRTWQLASELRIRGFDREYITVDNTGSKYKGTIYYHYKAITHLIGPNGISNEYLQSIDLWHSSDGSARFYGPAKLLSPIDMHMGNGTIGADGTFYAVAAPAVYTSVDSGKTKTDESSQIIVVQKEPESRSFTSSALVSRWYKNGKFATTRGCGPLPSIAADTSSGPYSNRLYVVWRDDRNGKYNVLISRSGDKSKSWSEPKVITENQSTNPGSASCTPTVTVNNQGVVGVIWYELLSRTDNRGEISLSYETWFTSSVDGGETFLPAAKLSGKIQPKEFRIGETIGLAAGSDGKFHALWIENQTGNPQVYYAPIIINSSRIKSSVNAVQTNTTKDLEEKIYREEIEPFSMSKSGGTLDWKDDVDWNALERQTVRKYGSVGREVVWRTKPIFYYEKGRWKTLQISLSQYIRKYGIEGINPPMLNNYAWAIFENFSDKKSLKAAAEWSLQSVISQNYHPEPIDTYAHILYRMGKAKEAIEWEEKALAQAETENGKKRFQTTIDKMKKGEPTWPVK